MILYQAAIPATSIKPDVKRIEDPQINSMVRLVKDGTTVRFSQGKKLFELKME